MFAPPTGESDRSAGASVAIEDGVVVDVEPAGSSDGGVTVDGEAAAFEPIEYLLSDLGVTARVDVRPAVPLGCGFGASGAATLATALAANERFDLGQDRETLLQRAHRAEVAAQTGLGDVFIQERGGIVTSAGPELTRSVTDERVGYASFGGIATSEVLGDEETMDRVRQTGEAVLARVPADPTLDQLLPLAWEFALETGLLTDRVEREVTRVRDAGGAATMAMVGETVVGVGAGDVLPETTRVATEGARLL